MIFSMKKIFKWVLIGTAALVFLLAVISIYLCLTIDKEWIERRMEASLSRKVMIGGTAAEPQVALTDPVLHDFTQILIRLFGEEARSSVLSILESLAKQAGEKDLEKKHSFGRKFCSIRSKNS